MHSYLNHLYTFFGFTYAHKSRDGKDITTTISEAGVKTPYLIATGETLTSLSQVFLVVETEIISEFTCLRKAIVALFSSFYIYF